MNYFFKYVIIPVLIIVITTFGIQNYVPLNWIDFLQPKILGTTSITTIAGSDTISGSRTTINNNFSSLNSNKIENSTSSVAAITTLPNLISIGTITTGVWTGTALTVSKGGSGTTTWSTGQVIVGNGSSGATTTNGWGTSGQFLTSSGPGVVPAWTTSAIDTTLAYNFTGGVRFTSASTTIIGNLGVGTTSPYAPLSVVGQAVAAYFTATTSSTSQFPYASSTAITVSGTASTTDLIISGTQTGGSWSYTGSSTAYSVATGQTTYTNSIPATANFALIYWFQNHATNDCEGTVTIARAGLTIAYVGCTTNYGGTAYGFTWSGSNFVVEEFVDLGTISGTAYWYK